ncbi:MAG: aminoglycoside phosphotransferase family protein [Geminicoccaceae bacterium]
MTANDTFRASGIMDLIGADDDLVCTGIAPCAHPIHRGLGGQSWRIHDRRSGERRFVKKLNPSSLADGVFADIVQLAREAHAPGLAPALLDTDAGSGVLVFEDLPETWHYGMVRDFRGPMLAGTAVEALAALHRSAPLSTATSPFDRIRKLNEELARHAAEDRGILPEQYRTMSDWVERIEDALTAAGHDPAPCKGECNLSDFMIGPEGQLRLVDFDRAANGDPFADLGIFANEVCRTERDIDGLVEAYCGHAGRAETARTRLYMVVSAFHLGLWGLVSQLREPGTEIEFFKYGQNQFIRCRSALSRWDVGGILREI